MKIEPINIHEAASKISTLQPAKQDKAEAAPTESEEQQPKEKVKKKQVTQPHAESKEDEPNEDADADATESDDPLLAQADDEAEGNEDADESEEQSDDDEPSFTIKVDGEEVEVSLSELVSGYNRHADYSKRLNELSKQKQELETQREQIKDLPQIKETYQKSAERFANNAVAVLAAFQNGFLPKPPSPELAKTNPGEFLIQKERHQEAVQFMGALQQELHQLNETNVKRAKEEHAKSIQEGRAKLFKDIPALQEPQHRAKLTNFIKSFGYTDEIISQTADPALFQWAYDAMKYRELMAKRKDLSKHHTKPKIVKNTKSPPGIEEKIAKKKAEPFNRHAKERSLDSAAAAIKALKG